MRLEVIVRSPTSYKEEEQKYFDECKAITIDSPGNLHIDVEGRLPRIIVVNCRDWISYTIIKD